jgi:hypothetical protein
LLRNEHFITLDVPGATLTQAVDINSEEQIVGVYRSMDGVFHMFLLSGGVFTSIDYPGAAATGAANIGVGINPRGDIVGQYRDASNVTHGFLLDASGYTTIDIPGYPMTVLTGISPRGEIVGRVRRTDGTDIALVIQ